MANEFVARNGLIIKLTPTGTTENKILVQDDSGLVKLRTSISLGGTSGTSGADGYSGCTYSGFYYSGGTLYVDNLNVPGTLIVNGTGISSGDFLTNTADTFTSIPKAISVITLTAAEYAGIGVKDSSTIYIVI